MVSWGLSVASSSVSLRNFSRTLMSAAEEEEDVVVVPPVCFPLSVSWLSSEGRLKGMGVDAGLCATVRLWRP